MVLFKIFYSRNLIQLHTKNAPNCTIKKKILGGSYPRTLYSKAHCLAICVACRFATCKFPN